MHLTFVCSGNTCRSPLAVAAWHIVAREVSDGCRTKLAKLTVSSAGLNARAGVAATPMAQLIAAGWDADLSKHRARNWQPHNAPGETIITMTAEQAAQIRFRLDTRNASGDTTIATLGEFLASDAHNSPPSWSNDATNAPINASTLDIPDPYGGSSEAYEECGQRILRGVRALVESYCGE